MALLGAAARLHRLVEGREGLRAAFRNTWRLLPKADAGALDAWSAAALELIEVNAGSACQLAFWRASTAGQAPLATSALNGRQAAEVCRHAGARAALACLDALPRVQGQTMAADTLRLWWLGLQRLAREAADCVAPVAAAAETLLGDRQGLVFANFVAAGLKAYPADIVRRRAFFALDDPWARSLLARRPGIPGFESLSRLLESYTRAVWGDVAVLRAAPPSETSRPRPSLSSNIVLLPDNVDADTPAAARLLYLAAVAHAAAHLAPPPVQHAVGQLKPMQLAMINLVEDARIEALAIRRLPGLHHLWIAFHTAEPSGPRTAPNLMARLSRALIDPAHNDPDGFVQKGRRMFAEAAADGLDDAGLSLRIGRILGNDLGQMRVQFNWRDYVIEPPYRDDGGHLWDNPQQPAAALDLMVQAARARPGSSGTETGKGNDNAGRARNTAADQRGTVIASYPEWDGAIGEERPDWTILRDVPALSSDAVTLGAAIAAEPELRGRIAGLIRKSTIGQPTRQKRQPDGDDLDVDAAIDASIALRAGLTPDDRLFQLTRPRSRDLATLILLDSSASTAAKLPDGCSVLDVQCLAVSLLTEALDERGDPVALQAFASDGREDVRLTRIKEFGERFDATTLARLAGLRPRLSTRLGTALRHAQAEFGATRAWRRLLLVLTDGEPSDIDVADSADLVIDAKRAVLGLRQAGIDVFGVVLDPAGVGSAVGIFGRSNTMPITDLADLPSRLAGLYFRLARR